MSPKRLLEIMQHPYSATEADWVDVEALCYGVIGAAVMVWIALAVLP